MRLSPRSWWLHLAGSLGLEMTVKEEFPWGWPGRRGGGTQLHSLTSVWGTGAIEQAADLTFFELSFPQM